MRAEPPPEDDVLWRLIESRDRAFATAHDRYRRQVTAKEDEIVALRDTLAERDRELRGKEGEIDRLELVLAERAAELREKQLEIARLMVVLAERERSLTEKEKEIAGVKEKDDQIHSLTREAQARLAIIEQLQASREYKLGVVALHPWRTFKEKL